MPEKKGINSLGVIVVDLKKKLKASVFKNLNMDIRLKLPRNYAISEKQVVKFVEEHKNRITEVEIFSVYCPLLDVVVSKLTNLVKINVNVNGMFNDEYRIDEVESFPILLENNAETLVHLQLLNVWIRGFKLEQDYPNLKTLSIKNCGNDVNNQVVAKFKNLEKIKIEIEEREFTWRELSAQHVTNLINNSATTLQHLQLCGWREESWLYNEVLQIKHLPAIKSITNTSYSGKNLMRLNIDGCEDYSCSGLDDSSDSEDEYYKYCNSCDEYGHKWWCPTLDHNNDTDSDDGESYCCD